jgi:hypothetical protein
MINGSKAPERIMRHDCPMIKDGQCFEYRRLCTYSKKEDCPDWLKDLAPLVKYHEKREKKQSALEDSSLLRHD